MRKENSKHSMVIGLFIAALSLVALTMVSCAQPQEIIPDKTSLDDHPPRMVSAFFGLDNALPLRAVFLSVSAPGKDGLPVTFSRRVEEPIEPAAFTIVTRSGARLQPSFATTRPANEAAKRHTILLIGELGDEPDDPPVKVEVTGHLALAGGDDARGLSVAVTPLADGPSLVLAYAAHPGKIEGNHPPETKQIVVVVWSGGVRPMPGITLENHLLGYSVATTEGDVVPIALGNLGDGDNYEHLYLDTEANPLRVSMKGGLLMDPRADPNPGTSVGVAGAMKP
ncbi:MAG: hypothetical protein VB957_04690 [Pseudomonadales bacterium]